MLNWVSLWSANRLRVVSLFSVVRRGKRETRKWPGTRVTDGLRWERHEKRETTRKARENGLSRSSDFLASKLTYVQKCKQWRKWRNWRKTASLWRFELDAKSGPLEAGNFGEISDFGKSRQRAEDNSDKRPRPWRLAILAKMAIVAKLAILVHQIRCTKCTEFGAPVTEFGALILSL